MFSFKDFFSKYEQICSFLRMCSHGNSVELEKSWKILLHFFAVVGLGMKELSTAQKWCFY